MAFGMNGATGLLKRMLRASKRRDAGVVNNSRTREEGIAPDPILEPNKPRRLGFRRRR